ncbi:MAG: FAD-dependent oxidoreductase [Proteobacteria bacterium]|nr:FAD-dependent oxidoreductase [Pseudomonadota bacterium]
MEKYPHIFSTGRIGSLTIKNRIKYAATETNFNYGDGYVTDKEVAYMEAQAKGGAGIVTTQGAYPDSKGEGKGFKGMMSIDDNRFIPGLAKIARVIKDNGALSCIQILHCGREGGVDLDYCLMPSIVPQKLSYFKAPREITAKQIKESVSDHIKAARRAVEAGYDMIELSGIVGYLISTFISRYTNKRQDDYCGDIRARCRLMMEIIQGVKAEVGKNVPVGIRLCGLELLDDRGGNAVEESIESFRLAEEAGADYLSVTIGWHESSQSVITRDVPMGHWLYVAETIKKAVDFPVTMAFRQFLPDIPERAIAEGKIDFWEACRPMIADPEIPRKAKEGKENEIIPCIACNVCFSRLYFHQPIMCSVRPSLGHEKDDKWGYYGFPPVKKKKNIIIAGGGPAGLQCAAVAAKRGHNVTLYEKGDVLGGSILLASKVDEGAIELMRPVSYLEGECRRNGVDIRLGAEFTSQTLNECDADAVIIAAGANVDIPAGIFSINPLIPEDIIKKGIMPGKRVLIISGEGAGLGTAIYLLRNGEYNITIVENSSKLGRDVNPFYLWQYIQLLKKKKAAIMLNSKVTAVNGNELSIEGKGEARTVGFDSIVVAQRNAALSGWSNMLNNIKKEVYFVGDAKKPRRLLNAIHDGYRLGMEI